MKWFGDTNQDADVFYEIWKEQGSGEGARLEFSLGFINFILFYFKHVDIESDIQGNDLVGERNLWVVFYHWNWYK